MAVYKKIKTPLIFLLILSLSTCTKYEFDIQGSKSETTFYSSIIDDDFRIDTYLPPNYSINNEYPTIILLDGDWYFDKFVHELNDLTESGKIEPVILVGIGYKGNTEKKRFRDYTFPEDLEYDIQNGKGDEFRLFLEQELLPKIESDYSIDTTEYVLMGHSLGGLHTLYQLLSNDSPFKGYVAISSSVWWSSAYLFGLEEQLFNDAQDLDANVYVAVGGDEPPSMTILNEELIERLNTRNYISLRLESKFFKGASHSQVPMIGFKKGIQFVLNQ